MRITLIESSDLPDAWFKALRAAFEQGRNYVVERGSFEGQRRRELDFTVIKVTQPGTRPIVPDIPPGLPIPPPTSQEYVDQYLPYLMTSFKSDNEQYTYGEYLEKQIPEVISIYRENQGTNQAYLAVGDAQSIFLEDPPCLRGIDTRIKEDALHFFPYFRSWDLWSGFPANLAALQLLKEYMASEIGVRDGEIIATSKGLHLYEHSWELAERRTGLKEDPQTLGTSPRSDRTQS